MLHTVGYEDGGRVRPIAHRLSFAEMVVPYRDPTPDHYRRTAFDIGEWGLGFMTQSLELGCDCLGEIRYLDAVLHDIARRAVHDRATRSASTRRTTRVLWKHVDHDAGAEVRRMRRLVVSFHVTVANYEYLVYWRFYQDGNIECEVRATGIMVTTGAAARRRARRTARLVDERTYAPYHQHFIVARLDLDVDGAAQHRRRDWSPRRCRSAPTTRTASGSSRAPRRCARESEARRDYDWATQRGWKVTNPGRLQRARRPRSPTSWCRPAASRRCSTRRLAGAAARAEAIAPPRCG